MFLYMRCVIVLLIKMTRDEITNMTHELINSFDALTRTYYRDVRTKYTRVKIVTRNITRDEIVVLDACVDAYARKHNINVIARHAHANHTHALHVTSFARAREILLNTMYSSYIIKIARA